MKLPVSDAKARLADLVRRAEAGEKVVLTRHGQAVARLVATHTRPSASTVTGTVDSVLRLKKALESGGVVFLEEDQNLGAGVRLTVSSK